MIPVYEVTALQVHTDTLGLYLREGWEPFAANNFLVYLRRVTHYIKSPHEFPPKMEASR